MKVLQTVKPVDVEKERCERKRTLAEFLESYNRNIPSGFPAASRANLKKFQSAYPALFGKGDDCWSLERHRKKFMDWLPQHIKSLS